MVSPLLNIKIGLKPTPILFRENLFPTSGSYTCSEFPGLDLGQTKESGGGGGGQETFPADL